jgi:DNA polymerase-4
MRYRSPIEVDGILIGLVERVTGRMRKAERAGRTVTLRLRFADFERATRSHTMPRPTAETQAILAVVRALMAAATPLIDERGLTLVGIAVSNFELGAQLEIPFEPDPLVALDAAVDDVRRRFGTTALTRAALLGRDTGLVVPLLPD